ncbi:aspartyl-phosphate phosphatase Spo0E family protein [Neobacillus drentensis]|uniref:aspartyl-phosphate phosphatase Spo0E family protein n=1 Tax=Neobacillus drentensis TaxID=220684 RepID=UPI002FFF7B30
MTCSLELLLLKLIDQTKKKMVELAYNTGINSQETIACSQELDVLLNLHMKVSAHKERTKLSSASCNIKI